MSVTTIYEDYTISIAQANEVYIKRDDANHILSKLFFTYNLQNNGDNDIQQILSCDNLEDLFKKTFLTTTFEKLVKSIRVWRLKDLNLTVLHSFFLSYVFFHWVFLDKVFNEATIFTNHIFGNFSITSKKLRIW
jgi:hypothetical protein